MQNSIGSGPYRGAGNICGTLSFTHFEGYSNNLRLPPYLEKGVKDTFNQENIKGWFSCFKSIDDYKKWFCTNDVRAVLEKNGFVLVKYECPADNVRHGATQSVFLPQESRQVRVRSCKL